MLLLRWTPLLLPPLAWLLLPFELLLLQPWKWPLLLLFVRLPLPRLLGLLLLLFAAPPRVLLSLLLALLFPTFLLGLLRLGCITVKQGFPFLRELSLSAPPALLLFFFWGLVGFRGYNRPLDA